MFTQNTPPLVLLVYLIITLPQQGCEQQQSKRKYLARVDDVYLTQQTLEALADSTILSSPALTRNFVNRWVDNELLYQEARREGMENTDQFKQQLAEVRKQLAVEALLNKEVYTDTSEVHDDSIRAYFAQYHGDFLLQQDVVKINIIAFTVREKANAFRWKVTGGQSWESVLQAALEDSANASSIVTHVEDHYYTQQTLVPPELWRVAINLGRGEISFPVRVENTYAVVQTLASLKRGAPAELGFVQDEIQQRLLIERRRRQYDALLNRLQSQSQVEITIP
jgi:peptidyl-prolyl cis-trans isomerase C